MDKKTFYRVCNPQTHQGLWYDFQGNFTGLIHNRFSYCANNALKMDYDPEIVGFLSATRTLEDLYQWFSLGDILRLQCDGWFVYEFESTNYKWYERFSHWVIKQDDSRVVRRIVF